MTMDNARGEITALVPGDSEKYPQLRKCGSSLLKSLVILQCCLLLLGGVMYYFDIFKVLYPAAIFIAMGLSGWAFRLAEFGEPNADALSWEPIFWCLTYVSLFVSYTFLTKAISGFGPSPSVLVSVSLVTRAAFSLLFWRIQDGPFADLIVVAKGAKRLLLKYAIVAAFYAMSDMLRMTFVQETSPSAFHVLVNLRVLMLVVAWEVVMGLRLRGCHWIGIGSICTGCFVKEMAHCMNSGGLAVLPVAAYVHLLCLFVLTTLGLVLNEKLLKSHESPPLNLQNLALYLFGVAFMVLHAAASAIKFGVAQVPTLQLEEYALLMHPLVLLQLLVFTFLGLATSVLLKRLSNIVKEAANGVEVLVSVPLDALIFGARFSIVEISGCVSVLFGIYIFAMYPIGKGPTADATPQRTDIKAPIAKLQDPKSDSAA